MAGFDEAVSEAQRRHLPQMAPRLAHAVLIAVLTGYLVIAFINIFRESPSVAASVVLVITMSAIFTLQVGYFSRPGHPPQPPMSYVALLVMAAVSYLPLLAFGEFWIGIPGYLGGSLLLALPPRLGWPLFGAVVASMTGVEWVLDPTPAFVAYTGVATTITGLIVYGLSRLAAMVTELYAARGELAQLAVDTERLRFARDLHDLLGLSLSAITLKVELASRLMGDNPTKAREELTSILGISRQALADVRSVARGYRELSLDDEYQSARAVLSAADISVTQRREHGELPTDIATVLATVLREGVANVLRHTRAERCDIAVRQVDGLATIDIVNDGVPGEITDLWVPVRGNGLRNLAERVAAIGGTLSTELTPDREFQLHAVVPLPMASPAAPQRTRHWRWWRAHVRRSAIPRSPSSTSTGSTSTA